MKSKLLRTAFLVMMSAISLAAFAQEEDEGEVKKKDKPVRKPYQSGYLIESQSYMVLPKNTFVFMIQHRFGKLNSNTFDLLGIYAPSNIRLGLDYVVADKLQLGIGTTKDNKIQDMNWKYSILEQTRSGSVPIAVTYFGNVEYELRDEEVFGAEYKASHRISYFNQLIVGRKFGKNLTVQAMANHAHNNFIDTTFLPDLKHSNFGIGLASRIKFSPQGSVLLEFEQPLTTPEEIKPNISFGVEISTSTHAFQLFVTTYKGISYQRNLTSNVHDFAEGDLLIGFNITRNWNL